MATRHQQAVTWPQPIEGLQRVELVDTPGIDEVSAAAQGRLAARVALQSDLVLLVLDADISRVELEALETLVASGKPVLTVLNRSDCWSDEERNLLVASIGRRVKAHCGALAGQGLREPLAVAAAPRQATQLQDGRVRSARQSARIALLRDKLQELLHAQGPALLTLNALRQAERLQHQIEQARLKHRRRDAQGMIGRFAAIKATGVAVNPMVLLDLAGGMACDTALVMQLCQLYELPMGGPAARQLLQRLTGHNALIGGAQLGIQAALSGVRQLLLAAAPSLPASAWRLLHQSPLPRRLWRFTPPGAPASSPPAGSWNNGAAVAAANRCPPPCCGALPAVITPCVCSCRTGLAQRSRQVWRMSCHDHGRFAGDQRRPSHLRSSGPTGAIAGPPRPGRDLGQ